MVFCQIGNDSFAGRCGDGHYNRLPDRLVYRRVGRIFTDKGNVMQNYTRKEIEEMTQRRDAYAREGMIIGLLIVALVAGTMGAVIGWLARGWLN